MSFKTVCDANVLGELNDDYEACGEDAAIVVRIFEPAVEVGATLREVDSQAFCLEHLPSILKYTTGVGMHFK